MAHAVVAYRDGKSPLAKFVTTDKDEADRMAEEGNQGGKTLYQVEEYDPNKHTGQPKMTPEALAEVGYQAQAEGQANRIAQGYTHPGAEVGEPPKDDNK